MNPRLRQLRFDEYHSLLDGGTSVELISGVVAEECLQAAEGLWPHLRLGNWSDRKRTVEVAVRCEAGDDVLVHVTADWDDCFLILVVPRASTCPTSWILFDIGAEYNEPWLECPVLDVDQPADEETIRRCIPSLAGSEDPFAILATGDGTYIQAYADENGYDLEYQMVTTASHWIVASKLDADAVVVAFISYAFGKKEWAYDFKWLKLEL